MNNCRITDMRNKEVISIKDGTLFGWVCDVEVDTETAQLVSIIIFGRPRCFGLFGREEDIIIPWCDIEVIGEDTILVSYCARSGKRRKRKFFGNLFGNG